MCNKHEVCYRTQLTFFFSLDTWFPQTSCLWSFQQFDGSFFTQTRAPFSNKRKKISKKQLILNSKQRSTSANWTLDLQSKCQKSSQDLTLGRNTTRLAWVMIAEHFGFMFQLWRLSHHYTILVDSEFIECLPRKWHPSVCTMAMTAFSNSL